MYSSRLTKSQKHNISICTFRIKDNTFPQQNLLTPTHSLLDNKSEFASLPPRRHLLWGGGGSLLRVSQHLKKLAEKSHLLVVTLMSPGSHRIMSRVACRLREAAGERLREATDDCALHQMRGVVETWICDVQRRNSSKCGNSGRQGTECGVGSHHPNEKRPTGLIWTMSSN